MTADGGNGRLRVTGAVPVTPRMLRVSAVMEAPHLSVDISCPNLILRLTPPAEGNGHVVGAARPPSRTYTIRRYDAGTSSLDIDVVLHGDGPFVRWALAARAGDTIDFTGPRPHAVPSPGAETWLMFADESGLPALASILESAPAGLPVMAWIEVAGAAEEQPIASAADVRIQWLQRHDAPAGTTGALERVARECDWPADPVEVWVAGEAGETRAIRRFASAERGVDRDHVHAFGYWRLGRSGSLAAGDRLRAVRLDSVRGGGYRPLRARRS